MVNVNLGFILAREKWWSNYVLQPTELLSDRQSRFVTQNKVLQ